MRRSSGVHAGRVTAYNLSAYDPIMPLSANLLPLTPISAFRPRRWRGAPLPSTAEVKRIIAEQFTRWGYA